MWWKYNRVQKEIEKRLEGSLEMFFRDAFVKSDFFPFSLYYIIFSKF